MVCPNGQEIGFIGKSKNSAHRAKLFGLAETFFSDRQIPQTAFESGQMEMHQSRFGKTICRIAEKLTSPQRLTVCGTENSIWNFG